MNTPHRPAVPRKWLIAPMIVVVIAAVAFALMASFVPGFEFVHGGGGIMLFAIFMLIFMIAGIVELFALAITVTAFVHAPELRTPGNFAAIAAGAGPFIAMLAFGLDAFYALASWAYAGR